MSLQSLLRQVKRLQAQVKAKQPKHQLIDSYAAFRLSMCLPPEAKERRFGVKPRWCPKFARSMEAIGERLRLSKQEAAQ